MTQTRFSITTGKERAKRLYDRLDVTCEDEGWPLAITEIDEDKDVQEVSLYVEGDIDAIETILRERAGDTLDGLTVTRETLPDIDWVTKSLEGLKPVRAGRFFVHGGHDRDKRRTGDLAIEIEAGLAFGTGHHGTTAGCLTKIGEVVRREHPRNALDLGTGSAVLAIAVAQLARIPVLATDIDPVATRVARENVRLNQVAGLVHCETATGFHHRLFALAKPFDLIVANILARPLMKLAPDMARHLTPGGSVILSGILVHQRNAVVAAFVNQGFRHLHTRTMGEWVTIHMKR